MVKKQTLIIKKSTIIILFIFFLDIVIKFFVQRYNIRTSNHFFDITYTTNTGTIWSLFANANYGNIIFIILSFLALGFLYYYVHSEKKHIIPTSIIAAGILGNLFDRIIHGYVIDWINLHWWPIFNIADTAIICGVIWLIILILKEEIHKKLK